jgi:hypothetical protein
MRINVRNSISGANGFVGRLASDKKKIVFTISLVALMAFMWFRVFTRKAPESTQAAEASGQLEQQGRTTPKLKISFVELPEVAGRNDVITRDFFSSNGWKNFVDVGETQKVVTEVNIVSGDGEEIVMKKIADKLKLEAIMTSENPRAFVNDRVLSVGDTLLIGEGAKTYECNVVKIEGNTVVIGWKQSTITLKIQQVTKPADSR